MMRYILILLALLATSAQASNWTKADDKLLLTSSLLIGVDWLQTRSQATRTRSFIDDNGTEGTITRYGDEWNPLLGRQPSMRRVDTYFISALILNAACLYALPERQRRAYGREVVMLEVLAIGNNLACGVGMRF